MTVTVILFVGPVKRCFPEGGENPVSTWAALPEGDGAAWVLTGKGNG